METARKKLKLTSIVLLILSALSLVRIIVNVSNKVISFKGFFIILITSNAI